MDNLDNLTGYGSQTTPRNLIFDGNEEHYEMWECKFLAYMRIKKLKKVILPGGRATADEQEDAFALLMRLLYSVSMTAASH